VLFRSLRVRLLAHETLRLGIRTEDLKKIGLQREPTFQEWVKAGALPPGWAADDGVALVFEDTEVVEAVSEVDGGRAFRVEADGQWRVPVRRLRDSRR